MSIATSENESELAEKVQLLSLSALKTYVQDLKLNSMVDQTSVEVPLVQDDANEYGLNEEVIQRLKELKKKGIDVNEALLEFLNQREQKLTEIKDQITTQLSESSSRYIPTRVRNIIQQEYGTKCAIKGCNKPSKEVHHAARFSLSKSHNPNYMAPLCKEHHQIAHAIDIKVAEVRRRGR